LFVVLGGVALLVVIAVSAWFWWSNGQAGDSVEAPDADAQSSDSATLAPLFASDEEALAAARATYEAFLNATDTVMAEEGADPDRIDEFATPELASSEKASIFQFVERGDRLEGRAQVDSVSLQSYSGNDLGGSEEMTVYVCVDISTVDVLDKQGNSTVASTRPDRVPFQVTFEPVTTESPKLLVSSKTVWTGDGVC
jgi:hypothetical protein